MKNREERGPNKLKEDVSTLKNLFWHFSELPEVEVPMGLQDVQWLDHLAAQ